MNLKILPEIQEELEEALYFIINSGYYSSSEIQVEAEQICEEICDDNDIEMISTEDIKEIITYLSSKVMLPKTDNYIHLRNVFDRLNEERIIAIDYAGYTLDDGFDEVGRVFQFMKKNNIQREGYCFYHQQDIERVMDKTELPLMLAFHSMNDDKEKAVEVGKRIIQLLTESGFDTKWNNTAGTRIEVSNFKWDKVYDGEDYGVDRAIRIMQEKYLK